MPRMYCSNASSRISFPAATNVSSATLNVGSSCFVSFHASALKTAIRSRISPRTLTVRQHAQVRHVHQRRLGHNAGSVGGVAAHHNRIGVQRLRQLERARPRRLKSLRQSQMVQRIHAVGAARRLESRRSEARAQNLRRRLANPLQARLPRAIVKGQHQQHASAAGRSAAPPSLRACLPLRARLPPASTHKTASTAPAASRRTAAIALEFPESQQVDYRRCGF